MHKLSSHATCTSHYTMNSCYDILLHSMLWLLCTKCKKLVSQWERHVLSAYTQASCLKLFNKIALKFDLKGGGGGEATVILMFTLYWDVMPYGLAAKSQCFKRICCHLQRRSLFCPEDGGNTLFWNDGTFETTRGHISKNSNLHSQSWNTSNLTA
jgi:hypothetical protein